MSDTSSVVVEQILPGMVAIRSERRPVKVALEFDASAAKRKIDNYIQQFYSDPMHLSNNKRRRMGMKPLRKPLNSEHRTSPSPFVLWKIVEDATLGVVPRVMTGSFISFADVPLKEGDND